MMAEHRGLISLSDVPRVTIDLAGVANQADTLRNSARKFTPLGEDLASKWDGLKKSYVTSHTKSVIKKMGTPVAFAERAEWVYNLVAWALDEFVVELRECDEHAGPLDAAVRRLHMREDLSDTLWTPGTVAYEMNIAGWRNVARLNANIDAAKEKCRARLDAIGEDASAYDPYKGVTSVPKGGEPWAEDVSVEAKPLDWPLLGDGGAASGSHVDQGSIGNCWFMSSLASLADTDPQAIERMVKDNGNGSYTVTLYVNGEWQAIQVDNTMLLNASGNPQFAGDSGRANNDHALWPLLVEKAAIKAYGSDHYALNMGTGAMSMELFTGNEASSARVSKDDGWSPESIARYAKASKRDDVLMTANSKVGLTTEYIKMNVRHPSTDGSFTTKSDITFTTNHVYQVDSVAPNGDVTLVNPHNSHAASDGIDHDRFIMESDDFEKYFLAISVGTT